MESKSCPVLNNIVSVNDECFGCYYAKGTGMECTFKPVEQVKEPDKSIYLSPQCPKCQGAMTLQKDKVSVMRDYWYCEKCEPKMYANTGFREKCQPTEKFDHVLSIPRKCNLPRRKLKKEILKKLVEKIKAKPIFLTKKNLQYDIGWCDGRNELRKDIEQLLKEEQCNK